MKRNFLFWRTGRKFQPRVFGAFHYVFEGVSLLPIANSSAENFRVAALGRAARRVLRRVRARCCALIFLAAARPRARLLNFSCVAPRARRLLLVCVFRCLALRRAARARVNFFKFALAAFCAADFRSTSIVSSTFDTFHK